MLSLRSEERRVLSRRQGRLSDAATRGGEVLREVDLSFPSRLAKNHTGIGAYLPESVTSRVSSGSARGRACLRNAGKGYRRLTCEVALKRHRRARPCAHFIARASSALEPARTALHQANPGTADSTLGKRVGDIIASRDRPPPPPPPPPRTSGLPVRGNAKAFCGNEETPSRPSVTHTVAVRIICR